MLGSPGVVMSQQVADAEEPLAIQIENLSPAVADADVRALFTAHGPVVSYARAPGRVGHRFGSRAEVVMGRAAALRAIAALDGKPLDRRVLLVRAARRSDRS